jgi:hypothetical protein
MIHILRQKTKIRIKDYIIINKVTYITLEYLMIFILNFS